MGRVQPDSSKTLSKGFSGVVGLIKFAPGRVAVAVAKLPGALGMSLTSGFQDHLQRPPPRRRPQLEGLSQVVADGDLAEGDFFFLEREKGLGFRNHGEKLC